MSGLTEGRVEVKYVLKLYRVEVERTAVGMHAPERWRWLFRWWWGEWQTGRLNKIYCVYTVQTVWIGSGSRREFSMNQHDSVCNMRYGCSLCTFKSYINPETGSPLSLLSLSPSLVSGTESSEVVSRVRTRINVCVFHAGGHAYGPGTISDKSRLRKMCRARSYMPSLSHVIAHCRLHDSDNKTGVAWLNDGDGTWMAQNINMVSCRSFNLNSNSNSYPISCITDLNKTRATTRYTPDKDRFI